MFKITHTITHIVITMYKLPKGTRDFTPLQMQIRNNMFDVITSIFKLHGANEIDTPVFELKNLLIDKYGEDTKLIYDLADQGGEILALRYDLTIPFVRYLKINNLRQMKRYQIGKVYRRDNPSMTTGRYREFYQCDFDIATVTSTSNNMISDAECICVLVSILNKLRLNNYVIKINHKQILYGIFESSGLEKDKFKIVSSSIDKLDKTDKRFVVNELVRTKNIDEQIVSNIFRYIELDYEQLRSEHTLMLNEQFKSGFDSVTLLFEYLECYEIKHNCVFDARLARGLDYYTGVIFEAVSKQPLIGSIAAGGRYDNLICECDCVGVSIGIERIFMLLEKSDLVMVKSVDVFVASVGNVKCSEIIKICSVLWKNDISAEMSYKTNPKFLSQIQYCEKNNINICVTIGETELLNGTCLVRIVNQKKDVVVNRDNLINVLQEHI